MNDGFSADEIPLATGVNCVNTLQRMAPFAPVLLRLCWLLGLISAVALSANSQTVTRASADYLIQPWNSEDGLPQNSVNCLAQTPDGYLWVGTRSGGLARFDGTRFVIFNPQTTPEPCNIRLRNRRLPA